jgi:hypothetical protein
MNNVLGTKSAKQLPTILKRRHRHDYQAILSINVYPMSERLQEMMQYENKGLATESAKQLFTILRTKEGLA